MRKSAKPPLVRAARGTGKAIEIDLGADWETGILEAVARKTDIVIIVHSDENRLRSAREQCDAAGLPSLSVPKAWRREKAGPGPLVFKTHRMRNVVEVELERDWRVQLNMAARLGPDHVVLVGRDEGPLNAARARLDMIGYPSLYVLKEKSGRALAGEANRRRLAKADVKRDDVRCV